MAMKKAAKKPASKQPNPPSPVKSAGKAAGAKMSKETSAITREKAAAYKKSGKSWMKTKNAYYDLMESPQARSGRNDLAGSGRAKFDPYGYVSFTGGRTSQRAKDQAKRAAKKNAPKNLEAAKKVKRKER